MTTYEQPGFPCRLALDGARLGQLLAFDGAKFIPRGVTVDATQLPGADLGAKINAANASLGARAGTIVIPDGEYTIATPIVLSSNRVLRFGVGTYDITVHGHPVINLAKQNNVAIIGAGPSTVFLETSRPDDQSVEFISQPNDGDTGTFGNYYIADFTVSGVGRPGGAGGGVSQTIALGNSKKARVTNVQLIGTHCIGLECGGANQAGGLVCAQDIMFDHCVLDGVATQMIAAVNFRNLHIISNRLKAGPISSGAYIDLEANDANDRLENFVIANNVIDVANAGSNTFGIFVQGNVNNSGAYGPGVIANNVFSNFDPVSAFHPPTALGLYRCRDVLVIGNDFRYAGNILLDGATRCDVRANRIQNTGGANYVIGINNSDYCNVSDNTIRQTPDLPVSADIIAETGASDWNVFQNNHIGFNAGTFENYNLQPPAVLLVGSHSRKFGNVLGATWDVDGVPVDVRGARAGDTLVHDGYGFSSTNRQTSDNNVALHELSAGSDGVAQTTVPVELGVAFMVSKNGYVKRLRFYKSPGDTLTQHKLTLWDDVNGTDLAHATTSSETASGWQEVALSAPYPLVAGTPYCVSFTSGASVWQKVSGWGAPFTRGPFSVPANGGRYAFVNGAPAVGFRPGNQDPRDFFIDLVFETDELHSTTRPEVRIASMGATDVLTDRTPQPGNYLIAAYYRVENDATDVAVAVTWNDAAGTQTRLLESVNSKPVGSYSLSPLFVNVQPTGLLRVTVTAGTAGNVVASAAAILL